MSTEVNCTADQPLLLTQSHGFLASIVTEQTQLGSAQCPWLISVQPDQTVSVVLHDFGVSIRHNDNTTALEPAASAVRSTARNYGRIY